MKQYRLKVFASWGFVVILLTFISHYSLSDHLLSFSGRWGKALLLLWTLLLMCLSCVLPTDIIHPLWNITFNVCVCCSPANSSFLLSFFFPSRGSTSTLRGTFQTLSREALLLDMTHEVRSPATAAVRSMSIDYTCKTRNEIVTLNVFCPISTFLFCVWTIPPAACCNPVYFHFEGIIPGMFKM